MRIAFLLTASLESPYGAGRCFPLARQIAAAGHQVHIVALHHDLNPQTPRHFEREGVQIHYAGQMHVRKQTDTTLYFHTLQLLPIVLTGTAGLARQARNIRADVYHMGKPHPQNSIAGLWTARWLSRRRLVLDYDDLEATINRFSNAWQRRMAAWLEERVPRWVDGVTVHSHFLETRLRELGIPHERILRLPSSADSQRFQNVPHSAVAQWKTQLNLTGQRVIAYVGTMSLVNHPVDLLLEAFARLLRRLPDAVLLLVGGGADLGTVKSMARRLGVAEQCRFVGRVTPNQVPALLNLAWVSVDPVRDDVLAQARWPLKIVESLAAGVPVVTGDVGDRREMLSGGAAGVLVRPGDPQALADGLETVLANPQVHQALVRGCRIHAARYDPHDLAADLLDFYRRIQP